MGAMSFGRAAEGFVIMAARPETDRPWVRYDEQNRIATVLLDYPPVNALNDRMLAELNEALDLAERCVPSVVVFRSGHRVFAAGSDLRALQSRAGSQDGALVMGRTVRQMHLVFDRLARLPSATIAEISGAAVGGGLELALACDLRVVANDATLGFPELELGLLPGAGGTQRLTRLCGAGTAARLILAGDRIKGPEAVQLGLAQWSVAADQLKERTMQIAERIAGLPSCAISRAKNCIALAGMPGDVGAEAEISSIVHLTAEPETKRRIDAFFSKSSAGRHGNNTDVRDPL